MKLRSNLCLFAVICAVAAAGAFVSADDNPPLLLDRANMLTNPDFERGWTKHPTAWRTGSALADGYRHLWSNRGPKSGEKCIAVKISNEEDPQWAWFKQRLPVTGGTKYRIAGWVKYGGGSIKGSLGCHFFDADGKRLDITGTGVSPTKKGQWRHVETVVTAPDGSAKANFHCGAHHNGTLWFDNVSFSRVDEPETVPFSAAKVLPCIPIAETITVDGDIDDWPALPKAHIYDNSADAADAADNAADNTDEADGSTTTPPARLATLYDDTAFYLSLQVADDEFPVTRPKYWRGDSIQFAIDAGNEKSAKADDNDCEIGIRLRNTTPQIFVDYAPQNANIDKSAIDARSRKTEDGYILEAAIPWRSIGISPPRPSTNIGFTILINDNDGDGRSYLQWTPGIAHGKSPAQFGTLVLFSSGDQFAITMTSRRPEFSNIRAAAIDVQLLSLAEDTREMNVDYRLAHDGKIAHRFSRSTEVSPGVTPAPLYLKTALLEAGDWRLSATIPQANEKKPPAHATFTVYDQRAFAKRIKQNVAALGPKIQQLAKAQKAAANAGIDTTPERVTLATARNFLQFARYDATMRDFHALAERELQRTDAIIDRAMARLQKVKKNPKMRRPSPVDDLSELQAADGYFRADGKPVIIGGFNQWDSDALDSMNQCGAEILAVPVAPRWLMGDDAKVDQHKLESILLGRLDDLYDHGIRADIHLGHSLPDKTMEQYPALSQAQGHFVRYDIDHPVARETWKRLFAKVLPKIADHPATLTYDLTNEPGWRKGSQYTMAKFRHWLRQRYNSIDALNKSWETSFDEWIQVKDISRRPDHPAMLYDWCAFNQDRVTDWFKFLHDQVHQYDPDALCHTKIGNENLFWGSWRRGSRKSIREHSSHNNGIDRQALMNLLEVNGCDTRPVHKSDKWALVWTVPSMCYDFQHSMAPDQPIFDSEWHAVQTVAYESNDIPREHIRTALWLSHLHGLAANMIWWWSRSGMQHRGKWFNGSLLAQPQLLDAYGRTMFHIKRLAGVVERFVNAPRPVKLLYSEASAIHDVEYLDTQIQVYEALTFLDVPIGWTSERRIADGISDDCRLLVVPNNSHVSDKTVRTLRDYANGGGNVAVVGQKALKYDRHRRERSPQQLQWTETCPRLKAAHPDAMSETLNTILNKADVTRPIRCLNPAGENARGVEARAVETDGGTLAYIANINKHPVTVTLRHNETDVTSATDLLNSETVDVSRIILEPLQLQILKIGQ